MDIKGKRFLIAGGASLVGSHTTEELLRHGAAEVVLFDNLSFGTPDVVAHLADDTRVRLVRGDVLRLHELLTVTEGIDGAYALAAFMSLPISRDPWAGLDVNIRGTQNLLEACRVNRVRRVVFASSSAAYGYGQGLAGDMTEDQPFHSAGAPPAPILYGASKIIGEQLCRDYQIKHGLDYFVLRYGTVYGERQHYRAANALYIIEAYDRVAGGQPPIIHGDGLETKDYVYVGDVARANRLAMASDHINDVVNIAGGHEIAVKDLAALVLRLAGSDLEPEYRPIPEGTVRLGGSAPFRYDNGKAKQVLGWEPEVPLEEGIRRLIAWRRAAQA